MLREAYHTAEFRIKVCVVFKLEKSLTPNGLLIECAE